MIVVSDFGAGLGGVGEKGWDDDLGGVVEDFFDAGVGFFIGKVSEEVGLVGSVECFVDASAAVGIGRAEVEEEGLVGFFLEEVATIVGHLAGVACASLEILVEVKNGFGGDVEFGNLGGAVSGLGHLWRESEGAHRGEGLELMEGVGMAVLPVEVIVEAGENDGARGRAGSSGGEGLGEADALGC